MFLLFSGVCFAFFMFRVSYLTLMLVFFICITCPRWGKLWMATLWIHIPRAIWAIPEIIQVKQVILVAWTWNFQGYWRTWKFQGSIKKEVEFLQQQECSQKLHVKWLGGNQKNVWLFGLVCIIHLPAPKIFFKFPEIFGAEERTYLSYQSQICTMWQFFKMHLWHRVNMFLESIYNVSLGIMNKIKNLYCFISISPCGLTHFKFSGALSCMIVQQTWNLYK